MKNFNTFLLEEEEPEVYSKEIEPKFSLFELHQTRRAKGFHLPDDEYKYMEHKIGDKKIEGWTATSLELYNKHNVNNSHQRTATDFLNKAVGLSKDLTGFNNGYTSSIFKHQQTQIVFPHNGFMTMISHFSNGKHNVYYHQINNGWGGYEQYPKELPINKKIRDASYDAEIEHPSPDNYTRLHNVAAWGTDKHRDKIIAKYSSNSDLMKTVARYGNKKHLNILLDHPNHSVGGLAAHELKRRLDIK